MWIVPLDAEAGTIGLDSIGGKASGLRRLLGHGFRVPEGYVVTTRAFRQSLRPVLLGLKAPDAMSEAVLHCEIPVEVARAVADVHRELFGDATVAVRSSATAEDDELRSFAGQLESVLGVSGIEAVWKAIRQVWASYFGRSNLLYRGRARLDEEPGGVAVLVQRLLAPRAAGVMFTADPVGGDRNRLVISATAGLGDVVVGGRAGETAYVDLTTRKVVRQVPAQGRDELVLTGDDIDALLDTGLRINRLYGSPQDVEWALDAGGVALLQCRPITAGRRHGGGRGPAVWSNVNVGEALPGVATPMTWSIIHRFSQLGFEKAFGALGLSVPDDIELFASFRGRVYLNLTEFASIFSQIPFMSIDRVLALGGGGEVETLERIGYERRSKWGFLARLPLTLGRMAAAQLVTPARARRWSSRFERRRDAFFERDLEGLDRSRLGKVLGELDRDFDKTGGIMLACGANFLSSYLIMSELLRRWGGEEAAAKEHYLFSGLSGLASAEPGLELMDMARTVRDDPSLERVVTQTPADRLAEVLEETPEGRALLSRLEVFLHDHGGRAAREAELSTPRWREQPEFLFDVIKRHLAAPYLAGGRELEAERRRVRVETTELVRQYFRPGLGVAFRRVLAWTQENERIREELRSRVTDTLSMYRHFFLELGRRLVGAGALADREDVFFLTRPEVDAYLTSDRADPNAALTVAMRRAEYVAFSESPDPPDTFVLRGSEGIPEAPPSHPAGTAFLDGLPASPGRVTARARVIRNLTGEAQVRPGEILVAPFTDVGWTPLFLLAAGVVTDIGGPLSHSAVVAREYGIPAVVNVKEGTARIRTGDLITLDGDAGRVFLAREEGQ